MRKKYSYAKQNLHQNFLTATFGKYFAFYSWESGEATCF